MSKQLDPTTTRLLARTHNHPLARMPCCNILVHVEGARIHETKEERVMETVGDISVHKLPRHRGVATRGDADRGVVKVEHDRAANGPNVRGLACHTW